MTSNNAADFRNIDYLDSRSVASSTASASIFKQQTLTSCIINIKAFGGKIWNWNLWIHKSDVKVHPGQTIMIFSYF